MLMISNHRSVNAEIVNLRAVSLCEGTRSSTVNIVHSCFVRGASGIEVSVEN